MAELVDARDSKSRGGNTVSVRLRLSAPFIFLKIHKKLSLEALFMPECLFCKIINKEISSKIIDENEHVIVIEDIQPRAPIHYLIIPKIHVANINSMDETEEHYIAAREMFKMIKKLAKNLPEPKSFNLISNNGAEAGQSVFHMHWHFMSGKNIYTSGLKL